MNVSQIKKQFDIFKHNPELVYLDNAATTQKPYPVIDAITNFYTQYNSNAHRGLYPIAVKATSEFENARRKVAKLINAEPEEIIFTSGATESINLIASSLANSQIIDRNSCILITEAEHNSNLLPWRNYSKNVDYIRLSTTLDYIYPDNLNKYNVISVSHINNATGAYFNTSQIGSSRAIKILDVSQSITHSYIDVKRLDVDFLVFSGHKMYGPMGIGVLYGKKEWLDKLSPTKLGGGSIVNVTEQDITFRELPYKFESGTPNVEGAVGLAAAIDFINNIEIDKMDEYLKHLTNYLIDSLTEVRNIKLYLPSRDMHSGIVSFNIEGIHPHDIAQFLGDNNICVRAGNHCTHLLHTNALKKNASVRVSLAIYNDENDIAKLVQTLKKAVQFYGK